MITPPPSSVREMVRIVCVVTLVAAFAAGCSMASSERIPPARGQYAMAIEQSTSEQLLRNIVRTRFGAVPVMLSMTQVLTQYEVTAGGTVGATLESGSSSLPFAVEGAYRQTPTITYTPVTGQTFALRMLSPVQPWQLFLLHAAGWRFGDLLRLSVQHLNGLRNLPTIPNASPERLPPTLDKFNEVCDLLGEMSEAGDLKIAMYQKYENKFEAVDFTRLDDIPDLGDGGPDQRGYGDISYLLELQDTREDETSVRRQQRLRTLLGLKAGITSIPLVDFASSSATIAEDSLVLKTRSALSMMIALTDGTDLPPELAELYPGPYDGIEDDDHAERVVFPHQYFKIYTSKKKPKKTFVAIQDGDTWFWIAPGDANSKATFALLEYLINFQEPSRDTKDAGVQLTLPTN